MLISRDTVLLIQSQEPASPLTPIFKNPQMILRICGFCYIIVMINKLDLPDTFVVKCETCKILTDKGAKQNDKGKGFV